MMENHCALGIRLDEILHHVREIDEKLEMPDLKKIAFEMNLLNNRMTEVEKQRRHTPQGSTAAVPVLIPHRSDSRDADDSNRKSVRAQSPKEYPSRGSAHDQPARRNRRSTPREDSYRAHSKEACRCTLSRSSHHTRSQKEHRGSTSLRGLHHAQSRDRRHLSPSKGSRSVRSSRGICSSPISKRSASQPITKKSTPDPHSDDGHRTRKEDAHYRGRSRNASRTHEN
ncbi:hypothetical protein OSTOST_17502 [Ostertagia ostertagi]